MLVRYLLDHTELIQVKMLWIKRSFNEMLLITTKSNMDADIFVENGLGFLLEIIITVDKKRSFCDLNKQIREQTTTFLIGMRTMDFVLTSIQNR